MARRVVAAPLLVLLVGLLCRAPLAAAQGAAVMVQRVGAERREIAAGTQATLTFRVASGSAAEQVLASRLVLPAGWWLVIPEGALTLPPHGVEVRLLRIALPANAPAGDFWVRYVIDGPGARDSVLVTVPARQHVEISVRQAPRFIPAGDRYEALFAIRNDGNAPAAIRLALAESDGFAVDLDSNRVHLAPGEEQVVHAVVRSADGVSRRLSHRLRLSAAIEGDTARIEPVVSTVEIIPRHAERAPRFRTIPSQLTLRRVDDARVPTVEVRGAGPLSSSGATTAEFLLRGPNQATSLSGEQDEYRLALAAPGVRLRLGDQPPQYSRLGESWRRGFGADADLTVGSLTLGAFDRRDRRGYGAARAGERGATLETRDGPLLAGARYLVRSGADAGAVWTTHARLTAAAAAVLEVEYGRGRDSAGAGGAYDLALTGALPRASYSVRRFLSDSGFPGLTRGHRTQEASATLVPFGHLNLSGSFSDWHAATPSARLLQVSERQRAAEGRIAWGEWIEAAYHRGSATRLTFSALRARRIESLRLSGGVSGGIASLRAGIEQGTSTFDDAPADPVPFRRLTVRASAGRGENLLAASVEWLTGMAPTSWVRDDHVSATLNASLAVTSSTRLSASLGATRYAGDHPRTPVMLDLSVAQALPFGQRVGWRTRALSYGAGFPRTRPTHQADYTIPLGVPTGMAEGSGAVEARFIDGETGRPLSGVLVRIGDQARFTDAAGLASFTGLAAATHYLEIDRGSLGADRVVTPASLLVVPVRAGATERIALSVARGARIQGIVRRFAARPSPTLRAPPVLEDSGPLSQAVLQLSNGRDTLRTALDAWGRFNFAELAPGSWVLSVVRADLPPHHRFEQERTLVDLKPGEVRDVSLRVIPSAPPVQIISEEVLTLDGSSAKRQPEHAKPTSTRWIPGRRRIVPPPPGLPSWRPGRRRVVPAPLDSARAPVTGAATRDRDRDRDRDPDGSRP